MLLARMPAKDGAVFGIPMAVISSARLNRWAGPMGAARV
jgi:hypothetical protein